MAKMQKVQITVTYASTVQLNSHICIKYSQIVTMQLHCQFNYNLNTISMHAYSKSKTINSVRVNTTLAI